MSFGTRPRVPVRSVASCLETALRLLGRRNHTAAELATKLRRKAYPPEEISSALATLEERGLLDDARAAAGLAGARALRGQGSRRIAEELRARGVSDAHAAAALAGLPDEAGRLASALGRRARTLPSGLTGRERSKKLFDHLVRRGFPPDAVREALRKKGDAVDDDQE
jgi:regulatory protein